MVLVAHGASFTICIVSRAFMRAQHVARGAMTCVCVFLGTHPHAIMVMPQRWHQKHQQRPQSHSITDS
eukprot:1623790-Alexandrium_andersonii.AAC.1